MHDIASGVAEDIPEDLTLAIGRTPRIFTWTASDTNAMQAAVSGR
jgi:hypothetical protein